MAVFTLQQYGYSEPSANLVVTDIPKPGEPNFPPGYQYPIGYKHEGMMGLGANGTPLGQATDIILPIGGAVLGAGLYTLLMAWAFHVRDPAKPKWGPAAIMGGGSLAFSLLGMLASKQ